MNAAYRNVGLFLILTGAVSALASSTAPSSTPNPHFRSFKSAAELRTYLSWEKGKPPLVSAHRAGGMEEFPENSIEAMDACLKYAPCILEVDVQATSDGTLILMHDDTLDRTTSGTGKVSKTSYADIMKLTLKTNDGTATKFQVPTLAKALRWVKGKGILFLDIKRPTNPKKVYDLVKKENALNRSVFITYSLNHSKEIQKLDKNVVIAGRSKGHKGAKLLVDAKLPGVVAAFAGPRAPDTVEAKLLHDAGIRVIVLTAGNYDKSAAKKGSKVYLDLIKKHADIFATNRPEATAKAIEEYVKEENQ